MITERQKALEDALRFVRGCTAFVGGFDGVYNDAFQAGVATVITSLERYIAATPTDPGGPTELLAAALLREQGEPARILAAKLELLEWVKRTYRAHSKSVPLEELLDNEMELLRREEW